MLFQPVSRILTLLTLIPHLSTTIFIKEKNECTALFAVNNIRDPGVVFYKDLA